MNTPQANDENKTSRVFHLEKATIEFGNIKVQMFLAFILCLLACLTLYGVTFGFGFFLDDFLHVDYVAKALAGQPQQFLNNFTGNWAGSDVMKSYRPLVSLSFFFDYLIWHTNAFGYHLTNVFLFVGCCFFVCLITQEITGLYGNRLSASASIWAGLLFAVYPLHPEAVAWPIGRVDLICGLFYLAAIFAYLRFRLVRERPYFVASILFFLLSLTAKGNGPATLPLVITLLEIFLPFPEVVTGTGKSDANWRLRLICLASFWITLAAYALLRTYLIGTLVGGYSSGGLQAIFQSWRVFADKATLFKIFFPRNEEVFFGFANRPLLAAAYVMILVSLVLRLVLRSAPWRPFIFLLSAAIVMVLPTFQVWRINPNLVGSRLFFISSAPFCIFIALAALPALDRLSRRWLQGVTVIGMICLVTIFASWSYVLNANLKPWLAASQQLSNMQIQLQLIARKCPQGKHILLLDLPRDYSGAGMLTRPQYLSILLRPPFADHDFADKFITIEPMVSASHDFMWPGQFATMLQDPNLISVYIWNRSAGAFVPWRKPDGAVSYQWQYSLAGSGNRAGTAASDSGIAGSVTAAPGVEEGGMGASRIETVPDNAIRSFALQWDLSSDKRPVLEQYGDFLRIHPGENGVDIFFPNVQLNPLMANLVVADLVLRQNSGCNQCLGGKTKVIWQSRNGRPEYVSDNLNRADLPLSLRGQYALWVGRFRRWSLDGPIVRLGLHFEPGQYVADLKSVKVIPQTLYLPQIALLKNESGQQVIGYDATTIANAHLLEIFFTKPGITFDANAEAGIAAMNVPASSILSILNEPKLQGQVAVPDDVMNSAGLHQARIQAFDQYDLPVGYPSEPVTLLISRK